MSEQSPFADLVIRILDREEKGYPVELSLDGQRQYSRGYLDPGSLPWIGTSDPQSDGKRLFGWLFADDSLKSAWDEVRGLHPQRRIQLRLDAPELDAIPWELLREDVEPGPALTLSASNSSPFSRYIASRWDPGSPIADRPVKIAVAIANPDDLADYGLAAIEVEDEWQALQAAVAELDVELVQLPQPCTLASLEDAIKQGCHILHFIGHGAVTESGTAMVLYLANDDNEVALAGENEIASMFARLLRGSENVPDIDLRLVYLSSCQTATGSPAGAFRGLAPALINAGVPAVMAMQDLVDVETARAYSQTFYQQLLKHGIVDLAANLARAAILTSKFPGASIPVLYMRLPDGRILAVKTPANRKRLVLAAGVALALLLIFALIANSVLGPSEMDASARFRIAVAPVAILSEEGKAQQTDLTRLIDQWVVPELEMASEPFRVNKDIQIWHDYMPLTSKRTSLDTISGVSPQERAENADELAKKVNAMVVIYGHLQPPENPTELVVEFYVAPDQERAEADLSIGRYQLGEPIPLGNIDPDSLVSTEGAARRVTSRTNALFGLLLILRENLLGQPERMLTVYEQIKPNLSAWGERGEGKETLYALLGDAALSTNDYELADSYYEQAKTNNRQFVRTYIGQGSAHIQRAQNTIPEQRLNDPNFIDMAIDEHEIALILAKEQNEDRLEHNARLALAGDLRVQGETAGALGDYESAQVEYGQAISELEQLIEPLKSNQQYRLLAQVYEQQGAALLQKGDIHRLQNQTDASIEFFELAEQAYSDCIAAAAEAPDDAYLQKQIADDSCRPMKDEATDRRLKQLQGE